MIRLHGSSAQWRSSSGRSWLWHVLTLWISADDDKSCSWTQQKTVIPRDSLLEFWVSASAAEKIVLPQAVVLQSVGIQRFSDVKHFEAIWLRCSIKPELGICKNLSRKFCFQGAEPIIRMKPCTLATWTYWIQELVARLSDIFRPSFMQTLTLPVQALLDYATVRCGIWTQHSSSQRTSWSSWDIRDCWEKYEKMLRSC